MNKTGGKKKKRKMNKTIKKARGFSKISIEPKIRSTMDPS